MALPLTLVLVQIKCSSMHRRPAALLLAAWSVQCYTVINCATQYYTVLHSAKPCYTLRHSATCCFVYASSQCTNLESADCIFAKLDSRYADVLYFILYNLWFKTLYYVLCQCVQLMSQV